MENSTAESAIAYETALKRVRRLKRFYVHGIIYLLINCFLLVLKYKRLDAGERFFSFYVFSTAFFWGIGLVGHGLSVLIPSILLGKDWEEKKIAALMEKEKINKWE
jgi:hypothetical protein